MRLGILFPVTFVLVIVVGGFFLFNFSVESDQIFQEIVPVAEFEEEASVVEDDVVLNPLPSPVVDQRQEDIPEGVRVAVAAMVKSRTEANQYFTEDVVDSLPPDVSILLQGSSIEIEEGSWVRRGEALGFDLKSGIVAVVVTSPGQSPERFLIILVLKDDIWKISSTFMIE